jgi:RNA polymerase sigma-B factor
MLRQSPVIWRQSPIAATEGVIGTRQLTRTERETATGRLLVAYHTDGDDRARERLVQLYLPLVEAFANRYRVHGAERDDLVQVGSIGLLNAIERFDPKRGDEFAAFAVPTIAGEIKRHLRDRSKTVRLPRRLEEASVRLPAVRERMTARLGRAPDSRELAEELGVAEADLPVLESPGDLPEEAVDATTNGELESHLELTGAFDVLDETERRIVYLRFVREVSRREAAAELGMTADQLRRRTRTAVAKLRAELEGSAFPNIAHENRDEAEEPEPEATLAPEANQNGGAAGPAQQRRAGERSGRILVRMSPTMHDELAQTAEREGVSLNQHITNVLGSALDTEQHGARRVPSWLPAAIVANIVLLSLFCVAGVVLLLVAWQQGW